VKDQRDVIDRRFHNIAARRNIAVLLQGKMACWRGRIGFQSENEYAIRPCGRDRGTLVPLQHDQRLGFQVIQIEGILLLAIGRV